MQQQGISQILLIRELIATNYIFMELRHFSEAYKKAIQERISCIEGSPEYRAWLDAEQVIIVLAHLRFGSNAWLDHLCEPASLPNLTITRE